MITIDGNIDLLTKEELADFNTCLERQDIIDNNFQIIVENL